MQGNGNEMREGKSICITRQCFNHKLWPNILNNHKKLKLYSPNKKHYIMILKNLALPVLLMINKHSNQTSYLQPTDDNTKLVSGITDANIHF